MKHKIYTVYDSKVESYNTPFVLRSTGEALRWFQTLTNDPETQFSKYPTDFSLFEIGEVDMEKCELLPYETKKSLGLAQEFKQKPIEQIPMFDKLPREARA